ncbi:MAG: LysR family transcriptional regulator [Myxococcota bacterium]
MNWERVAFDWNRARAFLVTAETGSYTAAAQALGTTQPTVGRQVAALEEELGVSLFERAGRGLAPTPTGQALLAHVRSMADAATRFRRVAEGQSVGLEGPVAISASPLNAAYLLPPLLAGVRRRHPGITLEVVSTLAISDLGQREADIAVRNARPEGDALVARKVREDRAYLYATPAYLASIDNPATPAALSERAAFFAFDHGPRLIEGLNALGLSLTEKSFPWVSADQHVQWALTLEDGGVAVMLDQVGEPEPRVMRALPALPAIPVPMWLTSHRDVRTSERVRAVFDLLAEGLSALPAPGRRDGSAGDGRGTGTPP